MKRKSNKKLTIALLALLGVVSTAGTYAYWAGGVAKPESELKENTITIGQSTAEVSTSIKLELDGTTFGSLVPSGFVNEDDGQVDEVTYTYKVKWQTEYTDDKYTEAEGQKTLSVSKVVTVGGISSDETDSVKKAAYDLVTVTVTPSTNLILVNDTKSVDVEIKVTLKEPANKAEYDLVAGKSIKIDLTFSIA